MTESEQESERSDPTAGVGSLADLFARQESATARNWEAARDEFGLIERGLVLAWHCTLCINEDPILSKRRANPDAVAAPETICANLLHAAWSSLVNATRLALFGAHVDALNLTRAAFEAVYHAEYFRDHPSEALDWDRCGSLTELDAISKCIEDFSKAKRVRWSLEQKYAPHASLTRFFKELSTYGSHANPKTVGLRLSSHEPGVANLGFVGVGRTEATRLCASHILHVLSYALSEFEDSFSAYLVQHPEVLSTYRDFQRDLSTLRAAAPRELSLLR